MLFKQRRVGKGGETFQMYKFRSMCVDAEERLAELRELNEKTGPVFKMAEDPRVTRVADGCANSAWTSCPSSSTCWPAISLCAY